MKIREIEVIARGACVRDGQLLLCHSRGAPHTFLPGGHVEFGEAAPRALEREIAEELGLSATAGPFLGAVEHAFMQKGKPHAEINLVFLLDVAGLDPAENPRSREEGIEFRWCPVAGVADALLEPAPLRTDLPRWLAAGGPAGHWASTIRRESR